jgi:hypothetical protein
VGHFNILDAYAPGSDFAGGADELISKIRGLSSMGEFIPSYGMTPEDCARLSHGLDIAFPPGQRASFGGECPDDLVMLSSRELAGIARLEYGENGVRAVPDINIDVPSGSIGRNAG